MIRRGIFFLAVIFLIGLAQANPYSFNLYEAPTVINISNGGGNVTVSANFSNFTEIWITDIGNADTANATQFDVFDETLTILESWLDSLYCQLTGCTMQGSIDMGTNFITNMADPIFAQDAATKNYVDNKNIENFSTNLISGSVVFSNGTNLVEDNSNFFWDDTNKRLGIGTNTPDVELDVSGDVAISNKLNVTSNITIGESITNPANDVRMFFEDRALVVEG